MAINMTKRSDTQGNKRVGQSVTHSLLPMVASCEFNSL